MRNAILVALKRNKKVSYFVSLEENTSQKKENIIILNYLEETVQNMQRRFELREVSLLNKSLWEREREDVIISFKEKRIGIKSKQTETKRENRLFERAKDQRISISL